MNSTVSYLLGSAKPEIQRLLSQTELFEREVTWLFDQLTPSPGGAAVDVGCGPLGVLPALRRHVGPGGRVVGVDLDPVMISHAEQHSAALGLDVEFVHRDATSTGLPADGFDLAHERLVLVNVADPAAVVSELVRLVRPGGIVVLEEVDWLSWQCEPPHPAWVELRHLLHQLWNSRRFDPCIGRRLPALFANAGVHDAQAIAHAGIDGNDQPYQRLIIGFAERFGSQLIELGFTTPGQLHRLIQQVVEHLDRPGTIVVRAMTVQAWGTVTT